MEDVAYSPAPPLGGAGRGQLYLAPTDDDAGELAARHAYAAMAGRCAYAGFPGRDWQSHVMERARAEISPLRWLTPGAVADSGAMWQDAVANDGWALYAEGLLAEPGPGAPQGAYTPEERFDALRAELRAELRVRLDTGLHTGRLAFEDAVTLYSETIDFLPGSCADPEALKRDDKQASCDAARREVTRAARLPTEAIAARLGRDGILLLRRRAQLLLGAHYAASRFHLELLRQGSVPPGYYAEELLHALRAQRP